MLLAIDFDGTVVEQRFRRYEDATTPLKFMPGAREGLYALRRAGHVLLLWSGRSSPSLLENPQLDPLVRAGVRKVSSTSWGKSQAINIARHKQMIEFVRRELPGVFDAIDDGRGGKPSVDRFIDDKALNFGTTLMSNNWKKIVAELGEAEEEPNRGRQRY